MKSDIVIVAAGDFPVHPEPLQVLRSAGTLIACDGSAAALLEKNIPIDYVVGDMDSLDDANCKILKDKLIHVREQDTNDLQKAFRFAISIAGSADTITIVGATGKREDHAVANISLLADFGAIHPEVRMLTDNGCFYPVLRSTVCPSWKGQPISLFNPGTERVWVTASGLRYPLERLELKRWWTATLNVAESTSFSLQLEGPGCVLVFAAYRRTSCGRKS